MDKLRLIAVDADDLAILSAHCQDAVLKLSDCRYFKDEGRFVVALNRFAWETAGPQRRFSWPRRQDYERRRSALHFERVEAVRRQRLTAAEETPLDLLAIRFTPTDEPSGSIELVFAGGSAIRLDVECIEARLTDLGPAWATASRPDHDRPEQAG